MERAQLLAHLIDDAVVAELKRRLSVEQVADLIMEIINPHRPLTVDQRAALGGVSPRAIQMRTAAKRK